MAKRRAALAGKKATQLQTIGMDDLLDQQLYNMMWLKDQLINCCQTPRIATRIRTKKVKIKSKSTSNELHLHAFLAVFLSVFHNTHSVTHTTHSHIITSQDAQVFHGQETQVPPVRAVEGLPDGG